MQTYLCDTNQVRSDAHIFRLLNTFWVCNLNSWNKRSTTTKQNRTELNWTNWVPHKRHWTERNGMIHHCLFLFECERFFYSAFGKLQTFFNKCLVISNVICHWMILVDHFPNLFCTTWLNFIFGYEYFMNFISISQMKYQLINIASSLYQTIFLDYVTWISNKIFQYVRIYISIVQFHVDIIIEIQKNEIGCVKFRWKINWLLCGSVQMLTEMFPFDFWNRKNDLLLVIVISL